MTKGESGKGLYEENIVVRARLILHFDINKTILMSDKAQEANTEHMAEFLEMNPVIATSLAPVIGYDKTAEAVKKAFRDKKPIRQVVVEMGFLERKKADGILKPGKMTRPGKRG